MRTVGYGCRTVGYGCRTVGYGCRTVGTAVRTVRNFPHTPAAREFYTKGGIPINIFTAVKENVTAREAAEAYGLAVSAKGMACCPFHDDRHPSMKLDERYYCFGCGEHGDVIAFVANLYNLRPIDAAKKLAADFRIPVPDSRDGGTSVSSRTPAPVKKAVTSDEITRYFAVLTDYIAMLDEWFTRYAPDSPSDEPHPRFLSAVRNLAFLRHVQDTLLTGSRDDQQKSSKILKERIHEFTEQLARYRAETEETAG